MAHGVARNRCWKSLRERIQICYEDGGSNLARANGSKRKHMSTNTHPKPTAPQKPEAPPSKPELERLKAERWKDAPKPAAPKPTGPGGDVQRQVDGDMHLKQQQDAKTREARIQHVEKRLNAQKDKARAAFRDKDRTKTAFNRSR